MASSHSALTRYFDLIKIEEIWTNFSATFLKLWETEHTGDLYSPEFFSNNPSELVKAKEQYMLNLLHDSLGFAGAKMIRCVHFATSYSASRLIGVAHVADMESISNVDSRAACERKALRTATDLLLHTAQFSTIQEVLQEITKEM